MAAVREKKVRSLPEYLELVEEAQGDPSQSLWYRGCGTATYKLLPSLYRHERLKTPEELSDLERRLMTRFRQRSIPYHNRSLADDWDALFFMQHYGVPTRLLDWTENPLIASSKPRHFLGGGPEKPRLTWNRSTSAVEGSGQQPTRHI